MAKNNPPLPDLDNRDIPDLFELEEYQLGLLDPTPLRWECAAAHCEHYTHVWDLEVRPKVYSPRLGAWVDLSQQVYLCPKHWKASRTQERALTKLARRVGGKLVHTTAGLPFELKHPEFINKLLP